MNAERWQQIREVFEAAQDCDPADRAAFLNEIGRDDPALCEEVRALLEASDRPGPMDTLGRRLVKPILTRFREDLPLGADERIGPYEIVEVLGRGGMGIVYKAYDPRLNRFVALKCLPYHLRGDHHAQARFLEEAKAASALDHPHICTIYDIGETPDRHRYLAMAYYEGQTLKQRIAQGPLPVAESVALALQVARGLTAAHEAGIVHRDIKPSNIMVTSRGLAKILDFGVAKLGKGPGLTKTGARVGTFAYMSPEQMRGEAVDHRTDLWSLGAVLYEMLTGHPAFRGDYEGSLVYAILEQDPPPIRTVRPDVPEELDRVVARALTKEAEGRFQAGDSFAAALEASIAPREDATMTRLPDPTRPDTSSSSFTDTRSVQRRLHNLPASLTSFVGREQELEQARALLSSARLLTLTGPAGTGKTRMSIALAETVVDAFSDGVFFVPLAAIADPELVPSAIAQVLGIEHTPGRSLVESLQEALHDKQALLVLDNFEQVVAAAPLIVALLTASPALKVLITSRVVLRLTGEHAFPVPPLEVPALNGPADPEILTSYSAMGLFVERARAVQPSFSMTDEEARAVAEICVRLEGLPLALELAAARIKLFTPQALLTRLGHRLDVLKAGPRDRPARHQTLRQAIAWSYDLLPEADQQFFRRMAVFVGGCTLEAAEAVGSVEGDTLDPIDGIATLVDQSLLRKEEKRGEEARFMMLETIREFGQECARLVGAWEPAQRAHAWYFVSLAEHAAVQLTGPDQVVWLNRLEAEHDNLRAALAWAYEAEEAELGLRLGTALWRFWLIRGYVAEGRQHLERMLALPKEGVSPALRARALDGLGTLAHNYGDNLEAHALLEECLVLWRAVDDKQGLARSLINLGWVASEMGEFEMAQSLSEEGLALNKELGEKRGVAVALNNLGWLALYRGEYRAAQRLLEESLMLRRSLGDRRNIVFALANLAWASQALGSYRKAETFLQRLEEPASGLQEMNDKMLMSWALTRKASLAYDQGRYEEAQDILEESMAAAREGGNQSIVAWVLSCLGDVLLSRGATTRAEELLEESLSYWQAISSLWGQARTLHSLGKLAQAQGDAEGALHRHRESLALHERMKDKQGIIDSLEAISRIFRIQQREEEAARLTAAAAVLRAEMQIPVPLRIQADYEDHRSALRAALGDEGFARAWSEGEAMPLREAIALGREKEVG